MRADKAKMFATRHRKYKNRRTARKALGLANPNFDVESCTSDEKPVSFQVWASCSNSEVRAVQRAMQTLSENFEKKKIWEKDEEFTQSGRKISQKAS